jgi:outer membrane receptor for ferrienterochelin and colicin
LHNAAVITISNSNVATVNNHLAAVAYGPSRLSTGIVPTGFNAENFLLRLDHQISDSNQLSTRYSFYDINSINSRNVGGLNAASRGTALNNRDQAIALGEVAALSSLTVNEFRFQYSRSRLSAPINDATGPAVNISGVASFGPTTFSPIERDLDTYEFVETLTTQRSAHSLKMGVHYLLNRLNIDFPGPLQGVYTFSSLANFQSNRYATFQQAIGATSQFQSNPNVGLFLQDEWKPRSDLTINFGLRYDAQFLPEPIMTDANNFAPRVGVAYAPGDSSAAIPAKDSISQRSIYG